MIEVVNCIVDSDRRWLFVVSDLVDGGKGQRGNFLGMIYKGGATTQSSGRQSILESRTAFLDVMEAFSGNSILRKKRSIFAFVR